jgi:hypothetical protein
MLMGLPSQFSLFSDGHQYRWFLFDHFYCSLLELNDRFISSQRPGGQPAVAGSPICGTSAVAEGRLWRTRVG